MYFKEKLIYLFFNLLLGILMLFFIFFQNYIMCLIICAIMLISVIHMSIKDTLIKEKRNKENHDNLEKIAKNIK